MSPGHRLPPSRSVPVAISCLLTGILGGLLAGCGQDPDAMAPPKAPSTTAAPTIRGTTTITGATPTTALPATVASTAPATTVASTAPATTDLTFAESAETGPRDSASTTTSLTPALAAAAVLQAHVAESASFTQAEAAWLLPEQLNPSAGGAPGYTRYVFRETSAGVVPTLVEGPLGPQVRCQDPDLPCSYRDLVELHRSGDPIPPRLSLTVDELANLVYELDLLAAFAADHADVDAACASGFVSDAIQTPNMGSHFYRTRSFVDGFDAAAPEILIYAPTDGSLVVGPLGRCVDERWEGPDMTLVGTAFLLPPQVVGADHPEGFSGDLDNWHAHFNLCRGNHRGQDTFVTEAECRASGGNWHDAIGWMLHAWVAPGHDNQLGVFSMWNQTIAPVADGVSIRAERNVRGSDFPEGARQSLIANFAFDRTIEVDVGQGVFFNNSDSVPHTVSAGTPDDPDLESFDSGLLEPGDNWELTTDRPGTFLLFCALHPDMTATVVVGGVAVDKGDSS